MKFEKLVINNFLTVAHAELSLSGKGLVLVQGENLDDPSAKSNGAGKSSIADSLCWALYGTTARGVSSDAVVNDTAKKDCYVEVTFSDGANEYRITRYRKDTKFKNQILVQQKHEDPGCVAYDLHKGTDRETQEVINSLLGCTSEVFTSSVYAGQEAMPDLPGMTDKQLKLLIEEAAGVERLAGAYAVARQDLLALEGKIGPMRREIDVLVSQLAENTASHETEAKRFDDFEAGRKVSHDSYAQEAKEVVKQSAALIADIKSSDESALKAELDGLSVKLAGRDEEQRKLNELNAVVSKCKSEADVSQSHYNNAVALVVREKKALATISSKIGEPCAECGKAYHEEDLETLIKIRSDAVVQAEYNVKTARERLDTSLAALEGAGTASDFFASSMTSFTDIVARQGVLIASLRIIERQKKELAEIKVRVTSLVEAAKSALTQTNPYEATREIHSKAIVRGNDRIKEVYGQVEAAEVERDDMANAVKVFSPAGVRARILDTVTPFLNVRTSEYLGILSDGNISATWSTLTRNKAGDLREKFNIEVINDKGAKSFAGLSGGEKRKVRLSCAMALQDLVATRAEKPIDLFIGDEIDDALDSAGLERLMTILEKKARERGTVLVISHNDLADWVDNITTVTKNGGYSVVSGALCE